MSDVERILEINHQRVRWAEEVENGLPRRCASRNDKAARIATPPVAARNDRHNPALPFDDIRGRKRRALRTASLFCAMMCGVSAACIVRGAVMTDIQTLVPGVIGAVVFLTSGWLMDEKVEELSV